MLSTLLDCIFEAQGLRTSAAQTCLIEQLVACDERLWRFYRPEQGREIVACYQDSGVQTAYLLRYLLPYAAMLSESLEELQRRRLLVFPAPTMKACFFGCGPATELCGLIQFLSFHYPAIACINARLVDKATDYWRFASDIVMGRFIPRIWKRPDCRVQAVPFDITTSAWWHRRKHQEVHSLAADADLLTFQNCFTEISARYFRRISDFVTALTRKMKSGAIMVLANRWGYRKSAVLFAYLASSKSIRAVAEVVTDPSEQQIVDAALAIDDLPENYRRRLYPSNDRGPTRWVRYSRLALIRK